MQAKPPTNHTRAMNIINLRSVVALSIVVLLAIAGCRSDSGPRDAPTAPQAIRVGVILPLTGRLATMGEVERQAMELAAAAAFEAGHPIELVIEDSGGNPRDAVTAARKLLDIDGVDVLLTSTTGASLAVEPIATERNVNLVAFCMDPDVASASEYIVRLYEGINEEARAILSYYESVPLEEPVAILHAQVPVWDKVVQETLLPFFQSQGREVVFADTYLLDQGDFRTLSQRLARSEPASLIMLGYGFEYPNIFRAFREAGALDSVQVVGGWGFLYTELNESEFEGILVSGPEYVFDRQDTAGEFFDSYLSEYGAPPNFDAAFAYNAIRLLADEVGAEAFSNPIAHTLAGQSLNGVVGPYSLDDQGNMIVQTRLGRYEGGLLVAVNAESR